MNLRFISGSLSTNVILDLIEGFPTLSGVVARRRRLDSHTRGSAPDLVQLGKKTGGFARSLALIASSSIRPPGSSASRDRTSSIFTNPFRLNTEICSLLGRPRQRLEHKPQSLVIMASASAMSACTRPELHTCSRHLRLLLRHPLAFGASLKNPAKHAPIPVHHTPIRQRWPAHFS